MFGEVRVINCEQNKDKTWSVVGKTRLVKVNALRKALGVDGFRRLLDMQRVKYRNAMIELA